MRLHINKIAALQTKCLRFYSAFSLSKECTHSGQF
jgi:hypothetical protein